MVEIRRRETSIMDNLYCKGASSCRVCEENKFIRIRVRQNKFFGKRCEFEGSYSYEEWGDRRIKMIFSRMIYHSIKVLVLYEVNSCASRVLAVVTKTSAKTHGVTDS